jgi:hypothetical protein
LERGEEITITKVGGARGQARAREKETSADERLAAIKRIQQLATGLSLGGLKSGTSLMRAADECRRLSLIVRSAVAWLFHDEATPKTAALLNRLATETALVHTWWFIEITNVLAMAERKDRITPTQSDAFIADLSKLGIE